MNIFVLSGISIVEFLIIFTSATVLTWYFYYTYCFNYWKKKGVPTIKPTFPAGNIGKPLSGRENLFVTIQNFYREFKSKGHIHGGLYFFNGPVYLPVDPELIKRILATDFENFIDRGLFVDEKNFPLSANLFSYDGARWKNMRNKISPSFSSGKLKTMYEIFLKMTENFISTVESRAQKKGELNIKYTSANFTSDLIFNTAFGLESETLKYPENNLATTVRTFFQPPNWLFIKTVLTEGLQNPGNLIKVTISNIKHGLFFTDIIKNAVEKRDKYKIMRKDFLSSLLEIRDKENLTFDEIAAQCFLFFIAGFETSSQTISCCVHELAHNQELQDKLRKEIDENLGKDFKNYSYEDIFKLPYLEKVFNETLRMYPALGFLNRICVKKYKVPGTDVVIEEGTPILIPVLGLHRDPAYFPDPLKFDPERFADKQTVVPFTFLPFGDGPRICIGMRYGKLQTKLGIAALISQFKFYPHPSTPKYIELDKFSKSLAMVPAQGIMIRVKKINHDRD